MLRNDYLLTVELDEDTDEQLMEAQKILQENLDQRKEERHYALYVEAWETNEPALVALGAAMMRQEHRTPMEKLADRLPCAPKTSTLAYYVADHRLAEAETKLPNEEHEKFRQRLLRAFDVHTFVFTHTHYDECHNGFFFRRS